METGQEWYEVYRILEDTYAIYEPFQFEEAISYLVTGPLYAFEKDVNIKDYMSSLEKLIKRTDEYDYMCPSHNEPWVQSTILPRILDAFKDIMRGKGKFSEGEGIRRYYFRDFDIIVNAEMITEEREM